MPNSRALVELYCASFRQVPRQITLDIDDTFGAVHGGQQLRPFSARYDDYGFQPIVVFDQNGRFVTVSSVWRSGRKAVRSGPFSAASSARSAVTGRMRRSWPRRQPLRLSGRCSTGARGERPRLHRGKQHRPLYPSAGKVRRFKAFYDAAETWSRIRRIIARVEAGADGADTRAWSPDL